MIAAAPLVLALGAGSVERIFDDANRAYFAGDFAAAADGARRLGELGVRDPDVLYNLGNAHWRGGRLGHAIWSWERARALDPGHEDAAFNLRAARPRVRDRLRSVSRLSFALQPSAWSRPFLVAYLLAFAGLWTRRWLGGGWRAGVTAAAALAGAAALACALVLGALAIQDRRFPRAIVLGDEVAVREGPDAASHATFTVHAGLGVRCAGREGAWTRIRLSNGVEGWVPAGEVGRILL
jgi:hypothetical protein